ncbi:MAG: type II CAAX endopeptidase family protein [Hyphomonas oceanitis]|uniref:CPBP family intramembrane glutamic endopeptidase n=1 Tax=Hyphomonas oceanitis TaxID=81033 RepID=UPI003001B41B
MIWTALAFAVGYQIFLIIPAWTLYVIAPDISDALMMGLSYLGVGAMCYLFLGQRGVAREVSQLGDVNVTIAVFTLIAVAASLFISSLVSNVFVSIFGPEGLSVSEQMQVIMRFSKTLELIFAVVLVAPVVEEFIYRGLLMGVLLDRGWTPLAATLLAGAIFSLLHIQYGWIGIVSVFVMGITFGFLRIAGGGLFAPILAHAIGNAVSLYMW